MRAPGIISKFLRPTGTTFLASDEPVEATLAMGPLGPRIHRTAHPGLIAVADALGIDLGAHETCRLDYWTCMSRGIQWHVGATEMRPRVDYRIHTCDERAHIRRIECNVSDGPHGVREGLTLRVRPLPATVMASLMGRRLADIVDIGGGLDDIRVVGVDDEEGDGFTTGHCVIDFGPAPYATIRPRRAR